MALSDDDIVRIMVSIPEPVSDSGNDVAVWATNLCIAIEAETRKQDEALIRQMLEALECSGEPDDPGHRCSHCDDYVDRNSVLRNAARKRLEAVGAGGVEPLTDSKIAAIHSLTKEPK